MADHGNFVISFAVVTADYLYMSSFKVMVHISNVIVIRGLP